MPAASHQALVIGGTRGVGRAVVRRLAREGHAVVAVHVGDDESRADAVREFEVANLDVEVEQVDVEESTQVASLFEKLAESGRSPAFLVNAVELPLEMAVGLEDADFDRVLGLVLRATFLTCRHAVKSMAGRRFGRIINLASHATAPRHEGQAALDAAHAGVFGLTRTLAREVGPLGITVNAVSPGALQAQQDSKLPDTSLEALIRRTPLGRAGRLEEVAGMVNMLCEDGASYITGQCLSIDGGLT
jgi:3-oxoacyl-[acyl-carrier protein] reductase